MFIHIAIFKWRETATDMDINSALSVVKSLEKIVPGIRSINLGMNRSKWNKGYTHAVVIIGETEKAIEDYRNHPIHKKVAKAIESMELDGIGIDFND